MPTFHENKKNEVAQQQGLKDASLNQTVPTVCEKKAAQRHGFKDDIGYTIITFTALACNAFLCYRFMPPHWALPWTLFLDGLFYVMSPLDLIPDSWRVFCFAIGKFDDFLAIIVTALGAYLLLSTYQEYPLSTEMVETLKLSVDTKELTVYNVGFVLLLLSFLSSLVSSRIRFAFIGIYALVSSPIAIFSVMTKFWAIGATLMAFAVIYYLLPFSLLLSKDKDLEVSGLVFALGFAVMVLAHITNQEAILENPQVPELLNATTQATRTILNSLDSF